MSNTIDNKIKLLPDDVIDKIAAGEVVERPASVVKELLENAIDAGARRIEIEIKDAGSKLIEISDDGCGMTATDATLALKRHATSKITSEADLERLTSLGFRGEALASIASVSRLTLTTRHASEDVGVRLQVEGGQARGIEMCARPPGTMIQVRNLFFNVPARRKFLKSDTTEMSHISDLVCHLMLGWPEVAVRFTRSNQLVVASSGSGNLIDVVLAIYGVDVTRSLVPLNAPASVAERGARLTGFISPPQMARTGARFMTFLVNRRFVRSRLLQQAVAKALSSFFPKGRYPILVLDLRLPPEAVDVNVHPAKTEVRFRDEGWIFGTVVETLRRSLSGLSLVADPMTAATEAEPPTSAGDDAEGDDAATAAVPGGRGPASAPRATGSLPGFDHHRAQADADEEPTSRDGTASSSPGIRQYTLNPGLVAGDDSENTAIHHPSSVSADRHPAPAFEPVTSLSAPRLLAQYRNTYFLGEDRDGLFLVDQHVAHERVLFDTLTVTYREQKVLSQPLLFPLHLQLLPSERLLLANHGDEFAQLGFTVRQAEDHQYYLTAIPVMGRDTLEPDAIQALLTELLNGWEGRGFAEVKTDLLKTMACKSAVKAGSPLSVAEMEALFEQLLATAHPFTCPHGRPIITRLAHKRIEQAFLRG